jgi:prophage DNA circulation protein
MSWKDKINNERLRIVTGEGSVFEPLWMNAQRELSFNVSEFEFPDVDGTLVARTTSKGKRYPLNIFFQGEDNIEQTTRFLEAAKDRRAWTLTHPLYGEKIVQPLSIQVNEQSFNVSQIQINIVETITEDFPKTAQIPEDKIPNDVEATTDLIAEGFAANAELNIQDQNGLKDTVNALFTQSTGFIDNEYFNAFNQAQSAINEATQKPLDAMRATQRVILAPVRFTENVRQRMMLLREQFTTLRLNLGFLTSRGQKFSYFANAGTTLSAMALSTTGTYANRREAVMAIETLRDTWSQYLADLDSLQNSDAASQSYFVADFTALNQLSELIGYTVSNVLSILSQQRQERIVEVDKDTNVVELCHRYIGLDIEDVNLTEFMELNDIGISELLQIRKGRQIVYFV